MNTNASIQGSVALSHWGVIRARGADAVSFLQGQLTNDVAGLAPGRARLAGFCSAKGRLQASFVVWKPAAADEVLLATAASVLPAVLKRLSMFVLRAKCKLSDASAELALTGMVGDEARAATASLDTWATRDDAQGTLIRLPDVDGVARAWRVRAAGDASATVDTPTAIDAARLPLDTWRWLEVRSGLPLIEAATVDQFVPQMLNFELIGGVDFQKGCYPGQEIVARSQYRGTIKRRMFLFDVDGAEPTPAAGQELFHDADPGQPAGMVVNAAPRADDSTGASLLAEVKLAALEGGALHLGSPAGPLLSLAALPYPLPVEAPAAA